jgi:hypothetical protein
VEEAMLGRRTRLDTEHAERGAEPVRKLLKFERDLRQQITAHYDQLTESRESQHLSPEHIQTVVQIALELAGQPKLIPARADGLPPGAAFHLPALSGSWALAAEGLAHPHTHEIRPVVFDHALAQGRDDVVLAHLNHRLVQMSLRLLRAEVWSASRPPTEGQARKGLYRVTARCVPNSALDVPAVVAHARLVVTGGDSYRLHEEIITAGGQIREGRFRRLNVGDTQKALEAGLDKEPSAAMKQKLAGLWTEQLREPLLKALEVRLKDRAEGVNKLLNERAHRDRTDLQVVMRELEKAIERELESPDYQQYELPGFSTEEREQFRANVDALRLRLRQIPAELERELAAINTRYADPQPRLFPVAVTFLVPEKMG